MTRTEERHKQLDLCIPYLFGRLNPGNRKHFESHLATGCDLCTKELARLTEATAMLPLALRQEQPSSKVKDRLFARIANSQPSSAREQKRGERRREENRTLMTSALAPAPPTQRPWFTYAIVFLSLTIVIALGVYTDDLIGTIGEQEQRIVGLRTELEQHKALLTILKAPRVEMVLLSGTETNPAGYGTFVWDPEQKAAFVHVGNLSVVPSDKEYQVWAIRQEEYFSLGLFAVRNAREGSSTILNLEMFTNTDFDAFAITLEPKGGSAKPTGEEVLTGKKGTR